MKRTESARILRAALLDYSLNGKINEFLQGLSARQIAHLKYDWELWARDDQLAPFATDITGQGAHWTSWLLLGGRGSGKTRAGAEWIRAQALGKPPFAHRPAGRIALVGETISDVISVMVEGESGLLAVHPPAERPVFKATRNELIWPTGAKAQLFSANDPEGLRGPQFHAAWCDELAKWRYAQKAWDMLQFGLRLGDQPRQVITTTPRPIPLLKQLLEDKSCIVSRARTEANAANLSPGFLTKIVGRYHGTRLGRQELDGEILEDREDALWRRDLLERCRTDTVPPLERIVVAVDPPITSGKGADTCGVVVAGRAHMAETEDAEIVKEKPRTPLEAMLSASAQIMSSAYVLSDRSVRQLAPLGWAEAAVRAFHHFEADAIVAEINQGGEMVETLIRQVDPDVPVRTVRATRGKWLRAEPVSALYEQGRIFHAGIFPDLEDQMCALGPDGRANGRSPDRVDALVWAITELLLTRQANPHIRTL